MSVGMTRVAQIRDQAKRQWKMAVEVNEAVSLGDENDLPLSNSRSQVRYTNLFEKIAPVLGDDFKTLWVIDRLTLVGDLPDGIGDLDNQILVMDKFVMLLARTFAKGDMVTNSGLSLSTYINNEYFKSEEKATYSDSDLRTWQLRDVTGENIAMISLVYVNTKGNVKRWRVRFDFNPQRLGQLWPHDITELLGDIMQNPHLSRFDIAVNMYNVSDVLMQKMRIEKLHTKTDYYYGVDGLRTGWRTGSLSSDKVIALYDKQTELREKYNLVIDDFDSLWRLELRLRREDTTNKWVSEVSDMLERLLAVDFIPDDIRGSDRLYLSAYIANRGILKVAGTSKQLNAKIRKLAKRVANENSLGKLLQITLEYQLPLLVSEISQYANVLKFELDEEVKQQLGIKDKV